MPYTGIIFTLWHSNLACSQTKPVAKLRQSLSRGQRQELNPHESTAKQSMIPTEREALEGFCKDAERVSQKLELDIDKF